MCLGSVAQRQRRGMKQHHLGSLSVEGKGLSTELWTLQLFSGEDMEKFTKEIQKKKSVMCGKPRKLLCQQIFKNKFNHRTMYLSSILPCFEATNSSNFSKFFSHAPFQFIK